MLAVRFPKDLEHRLVKLSSQTGRTKSHYLKKALEEYLEEHEDFLLAVARLEKKNPRISLKELEKKLNVES